MADAAPSDRRLILLHPDDNVLICATHLARGEQVVIDGHPLAMPEDVALGHKLARHALAAGDKVRRYGIAIGTMRAPAAMGAHVHRHNLASDYIPAHARGGAQ